MAYTLLLDELAAQMQAHTVAAGVGLVLGREVSMPNWDEIRDRFDTALNGPLDHDRAGGDTEADTPQLVLMRALGMA